MNTVLYLALAATCSAQFGSFFDHIFQQGQQGQQPKQAQTDQRAVNNMVENTYNQLECGAFLCEDTLACVESPLECPCLFPESQLKCVYPDNSGYVCISQPTNEQGPDCQFVLDAYAGKSVHA